MTPLHWVNVIRLRFIYPQITQYCFEPSNCVAKGTINTPAVRIQFVILSYRIIGYLLEVFGSEGGGWEGKAISISPPASEGENSSRPFGLDYI